MIERIHTLPDGTKLTEWVPEPPKSLTREDWTILVSRAQEQVTKHSAQAAKALGRLDFHTAYVHARAVWSWAKLVVVCKRGRDG